MGSDQDLEKMRQQASRFGFSLSNETLEELLTSANELEAAAATLTEESQEGTSIGRRSEDEFNALLEVYNEPRHQETEGPLSNISIAVKDNIAVKDLTMTCGSEVFSFVPSFDAPVVERLLTAGAHLVGKANMDAFAFGPTGEFSDYGPVLNPIDQDVVPGGSSSGSGAAVAAGLVDVALGSDTGGSVRIPAACCGIVGTKPTHGSMPRSGFVDFAPSLDTVGPLTEEVSTAATVVEAMTGSDIRDPSGTDRSLPDTQKNGRNESNFTVGLPEEFFAASAEVVTTPVREMSKRLADRGMNVESVTLPIENLLDAYFLIGATEFAWFLDQSGITRGQGTGYSEGIRRAITKLKQDDLGEHIAARVLPSAYLDTQTSGQAYTAARQESLRLKRTLRTIFTEVDALLLPTLRILPPQRNTTHTTEEMIGVLGNTAPFNLTETPAITIPIAEEQDRPISAQVVTPRFTEDRAFKIARLIEEEAA